MKQIFCDRCGAGAMTESSLKLKITKPDEQGTMMDYHYEFDLCPKCSEELLTDIQTRIVQRLTKGGEECLTKE